MNKESIIANVWDYLEGKITKSECMLLIGDSNQISEELDKAMLRYITMKNFINGVIFASEVIKTLKVGKGAVYKYAHGIIERKDPPFDLRCFGNARKYGSKITI